MLKLLPVASISQQLEKRSRNCPCIVVLKDKPADKIKLSRYLKGQSLIRERNFISWEKKKKSDSDLSAILRHENESNCPTFVLHQSFHTCFIHVKKGITTKSGAVTR